MMKSLYSGVAGLKTHNQRMDVIGNNIANVNTTAFKTSTVTFKDVYYQTKGYASAGTAVNGGMNPRQVGYGSALGTINQVMTQSGFTYSDNVYDCALSGEGFFQVMDGAGRIFYTRNGTFTVDSAGNLVDPSGKIVLGVSGDSFGVEASSRRIQINVPAVDNNRASVTKEFKGYFYTIQAAGFGDAGNISLTLQNNENTFATLNGNNLTVQMDLTQDFANQQEFEDAINRAIRAGGVNLPDTAIPLTLRFDGTPTDTSARSSANVMEFLNKGGQNFFFNFECSTPGAFGNAYEIDVKVSPNAVTPIVSWAGDVMTITLPGKTEMVTRAKQVENSSYDPTQPADPASNPQFLDHPDYQTIYDEIYGSGGLSDTAKTEEAAYLTAQKALDAASEKAIAAGIPPANDPDVDSALADRDAAKLVYDTALAALTNRLADLKTVSEMVEKPVYSSTTDTLLSEINLAIMKAAGAVPFENPDPNLVQKYKDAMAQLSGVDEAGNTLNDASGNPLFGVDSNGDPVHGLQGRLDMLLGQYQFYKDMLDNMDSTVDPALFAAQSAETTKYFNDLQVAQAAVRRQNQEITRLFNTAYYDGGDAKKFMSVSLANLNGEGGIAADPPVYRPTIAELLKSVGTQIKRVGMKDGEDNFYQQVAKAMGTVKLDGGRIAALQSVDDLDTVQIDNDGTIYGQHAVHGRLVLGRIDVVTFQNPVGLNQVGTSYWAESLASGPATVKIPGQDGAATVVQGAIEMSNVDLSQEFSDMIITQRGFQANSRVITVSDTMLEELINLKR